MKLNPIKQALSPSGAQRAKQTSYGEEPHATTLHRPTHKHKVATGRKHIVPMKGGLRNSAAGRDRHTSSSKSPKLPGLREPSSLQKGVGRGGMMIPPTGVKRFGDQGGAY
jgi:hypothetical protein